MDIKKIIENEEVIIKYQPIMSSHNKKFLGMEALVRGINQGGEISPFHLFQEATKEDVVLSLDKLCIKKSMAGFQKFYKVYPKTLLFINIDATVIEYYTYHGYVEELLDKYNIPANNVVLEINELPSSSLDKMKKFSIKYKALGCLIALDDIGAGESNLDRIPLIMPDIIKIDKELIQGVNKSFFRRQVVGRIVQMATNLGAQIVVEGIESVEDVYGIAAYGSHLIQGYFLGKPNVISLEFYEKTMANKELIIEMMHKHIKVTNCKRKLLQDYMNNIVAEMQLNLNMFDISYYKIAILEHIHKYDEIESVYVLDSDGRLITDTIFNYNVKVDRNNLLYNPCVCGDSVELEEYFTKIIYSGFSFWISNEYISMATGNKCYTFSSCYEVDKDQYIICIDFNSGKMKHKLVDLKKEVKISY